MSILILPHPPGEGGGVSHQDTVSGASRQAGAAIRLQPGETALDPEHLNAAAGAVLPAALQRVSAFGTAAVGGARAQRFKGWGRFGRWRRLGEARALD